MSKKPYESLMYGYDRKGKKLWSKRMPSIADIDKADKVVSEFGQTIKDNHPRLLKLKGEKDVSRSTTATPRRIVRRKT